MKTQNKLEWREQKALVIGEGWETILVADTDTTPEQFRYRYLNGNAPDDIGLIKIANNLNENPCLWIKMAGGNWQHVDVFETEQAAKEAANTLFGISNQNKNQENKEQNKMSYEPFATQDQQDDYNNFQPSAFQGCSQLDADEAAMDDYRDALESNVEGFAELRGLKYRPCDEGLQKLYFAWLKATQPHHEDLDEIGERKMTEAEAQEMAQEEEMEREQWHQAIGACEGMNGRG